ncbi:hypothetical protein D3C74_412830 [compost metagenome]
MFPERSLLPEISDIYPQRHEQQDIKQYLQESTALNHVDPRRGLRPDDGCFSHNVFHKHKGLKVVIDRIRCVASTVISSRGKRKDHKAVSSH